jgi:hypothetical protein
MIHGMSRYSKEYQALSYRLLKYSQNPNSTKFTYPSFIAVSWTMNDHGRLSLIRSLPVVLVYR